MRSLVCITTASIVLLVLSGSSLATRDTERLRGRRQGRNLTGKTFCRMTFVENWTELPNGAFVSTESTACVPVVWQKETDDLLSIHLPDHIVKANRVALQAGKLFLSITNATVADGEKVSLDPESKIEVIRDPRSTFRTVKNLSDNATGNKTIAVVRVSTADASPTPDADTLAYRLFSPDEVNLKTQYAACSFGKLQWELSPAGIVEVKVEQNVADFDNGASLVAAAQQVLDKEMNIQASKLADKVIMCLPSGVRRGFIASSGLHHWRAQFNDEWCLSLTATIHEVGHMLGLLHSNENAKPYGDSTGYMSFGNKSAKYPRKCFNGLQNWQLGWYDDRQMVIDTVSDEVSYLIKLATFVDFDKTEDDEPVLIKVLDQLYLQYNRAKGMNIDTEEKVDQVTITAEGEGGSELLAGLGEGDQYKVKKFRGTTRQLIIAACEIATNKSGADIMLVSVSLDGQSRCPDFYNEEWAAGVAKIHSDLHLPDKNEVVDPVNVPRKDPAEHSVKEGVGRNGFWDLFDDRHNQSPPNIDALLKSAEVGDPAEPEPQAEDELSGAMSRSSSSSVLSGFLGEDESGKGGGTDSPLPKYFNFASFKKDADCESEANRNSDSPCITSVFTVKHWFHQDDQP